MCAISRAEGWIGWRCRYDTSPIFRSASGRWLDPKPACPPPRVRREAVQAVARRTCPHPPGCWRVAGACGFGGRQAPRSDRLACPANLAARTEASQSGQDMGCGVGVMGCTAAGLSPQGCDAQHRLGLSNLASLFSSSDFPHRNLHRKTHRKACPPKGISGTAPETPLGGFPKTSGATGSSTGTCTGSYSPFWAPSVSHHSTERGSPLLVRRALGLSARVFLAFRY